MSDVKLKFSQLPVTTTPGNGDRIVLNVPISGGKFRNKIITFANFVAGLGGGGGSYTIGDAFYLKSPDGKFHLLSVGNDGALTCAETGVDL